MRILVTGGTGFIGSALVRRLVDRGDDVVVFSRNVPPPKEPAAHGHARVTHVQWTPETAGPWQETVKEVDAVVHLAGQGIMDHRWSPEFLEACRNSRIRPTRLLADALCKGTRCKTWVSASAVGYYGMDTGGAEVDESTPAGTDVLARMCVDWEGAADPARDAGVRVSHPRIGLVLGRDGGVFAKMLPAFKAFVGGPLGCGIQYFPWVHIEDTVSALVFAVDTKDFQGPFNLVSPNPVTMGEFARSLGSALGRPSFMAVPAFALKLALGEQSRALLTGQRAIPKKLADARFPFLYPELGSALSDLTE
ncbi:MAG: TIGR01777 family protein [Polyangiaceae bacterium]|nr:TIGR01777 family protein [Polyangiaceae bacterium]